MSGDDRTDRAKRIQRMRQGRRNGGDEDTETGADAPESDEPDTQAGGTAADSAPAPADGTQDDEAEPDTGETETNEMARGELTTDAEEAQADGDETDGTDGHPAPADEGVVTGDEGTGASPDESEGDVDVPSLEAEMEATDDDETAVLEFVLGSERYCLDISYIEQIVERGTVTRIPNAPETVEGVIDLRGNITTVIDPKRTLNADDGEGELIIVFDSENMDEDWNVGWAVDDVRRVSRVADSDVKESPLDEPWINGVIKREDEDEFVIWTEPDQLMRA